MNLILNNRIAEHKDVETTMIYTHVLKEEGNVSEVRRMLALARVNSDVSLTSTTPWGLPTSNGRLLGAMAIYDCNACGYRWEGDSVRCPKCSVKSLNVAVTLSGNSVSTGCGRVGTVVDEPATQGRSHTIRTETPLGAKSSSEFDLLRGFTFSAAGRSDVGKPGEPQVVRTLIEHLAIRRITADELKPLDEKEKSRWDAGGIDAKLHIRGQEFHVQVTVVPGDPAYWRSACDGLSNRCGNLGDAAQILSEAIDRKKGVASPTTILALDARHAGVVTESQVVAEYFRTQGDQAVRRFAAVVVVGAAAHLCVTIASRIG